MCALKTSCKRLGLVTICKRYKVCILIPSITRDNDSNRCGTSSSDMCVGECNVDEGPGVAQRFRSLPRIKGEAARHR